MPTPAPYHVPDALPPDHRRRVALLLGVSLVQLIALTAVFYNDPVYDLFFVRHGTQEVLHDLFFSAWFGFLIFVGLTAVASAMFVVSGQRWRRALVRFQVIAVWVCPAFWALVGVFVLLKHR